MTWSAPIERAMSTFCVLQTAVTSVPNDLASCTANDPTPPDDLVNQDLLPRLNLSFVAKTPQSGDRRYRDGGGGLKRETGRFQDQFVFISTRILGKRTLAYPEHLIPWLELLDGCANGLHPPGDVDSEDRVDGFEKHTVHEAAHHRCRCEAPEIKRVGRCRLNFYQHLIVFRNRFGDLPELKHIRGGIFCIHNRFHLDILFH